MNDDRRKLLSKVSELLAEKERDYFDSIPENMQSSDKGSRVEEVADALQDAVSSLDDIMGTVEGAGQ